MQKQTLKCSLIEDTVTLTVISLESSGLGSAHVLSQQDVVCSHEGVCERYGWQGCIAKERQVQCDEGR